MTHPTDDDLILYYYAEGDGLPDAREHLSQCPVCLERLAELEHSLAVVSASSVPQRDESYGGTVWARIQPQLEESRARRWVRWLQAGFVASPRFALAGGMALLVVAAFVAGRNWRSQAPVPTTTGPTTTEAAADSMAADGRQRVLYGAVGDHLERSAMVLTEFANRADAGSTDISGEQAFTGDLVAANRLYRQSASRQGEAGMAHVLEQLERVLVEISNSPSTMSAAQLQDLRQRIDDQGLLFKVRVLETQARQRQREVAPAAKPAATKS